MFLTFITKNLFEMPLKVYNKKIMTSKQNMYEQVTDNRV